MNDPEVISSVGAAADAAQRQFVQFEVILDPDEEREYSERLVDVGHMLPSIINKYGVVVTDLTYKNGVDAAISGPAETVFSSACRLGGDDFRARMETDQHDYARLMNLLPDQFLHEAAPDPSKFIVTITTVKSLLDHISALDPDERVKQFRRSARWMICFVDAEGGLFNSLFKSASRTERLIDETLELTTDTVLDTEMNPERPDEGDVQLVSSVEKLGKLLAAKGITKILEQSEDDSNTARIVPIRPEFAETDTPEQRERVQDFLEKLWEEDPVPLNSSLDKFYTWIYAQGTWQSRYNEFLVPIFEDIVDHPNDLRLMTQHRLNLIRGVADGLAPHIALEMIRQIDKAKKPYETTDS